MPQSVDTPASKVGSGPTFVFTAAGDYGLGRDASATLEGIAHAGVKFHLALGDLSYSGPRSESAWCDLVKSKVGRDFPVELLAGNHEEDSGEDGHIRNFAACLPDRMNSVGDYATEYYFDVLGLPRFILPAISAMPRPSVKAGLIPMLCPRFLGSRACESPLAKKTEAVINRSASKAQSG
jgi:hypothetical protein